MHLRMTARRWALLAAVAAVSAVALPASLGAQAKKAITHDVYDSWKSIQGTRVARDGGWLVYSLTPQEGDAELVARNLKSGAEFRHPRGRDAIITSDGLFVVFTIAPPKAEVDQAKKDKKKPEEMPKNGLGLMNLSTGKVETVDRVKSFKVADEGPRVVAYLLEAEKAKEPAKPEAKPDEKKPADPAAKKPKEKKKDPGTELVVRELATGATTSIKEVVEYVWSKDGAWLGYATSSDPKTPERDGAFARKTADGSVKALATGLGHYKGLAFDEAGGQLAFLADRDDYKADAPAFKLYHWSPAAETASELASSATAGMPKGWAPSENGRLEFSKDGARLFLGTSIAPKADPEDAPEPVKVDIWNWKDPFLQPMQKVQAEETRKRTYRAVVHLKDRRFVQLAGEDMPGLTTIDHPAVALGSSDVPYRQLVSWDTGFEDLYAVNLADGSRKKLVEKSRFGGTLSPGGAYVMTFDADDSQWYSVRVSDGLKVNLTGKLGVRFDDETGDTPEPQPAYGLVGWTSGDRSVLLNDRYDVWEIKPDGTEPRLVTGGQGRKSRVVFRLVRLDAEERPAGPGGPGGFGGRGAGSDKPVATDKPMLFSTVNDETKATGYARVTPLPPAPAAPVKGAKPARKGAAVPAPLPGLPGGYGEPSRLVSLDKMFGGLVKPKNAEAPLVFTLQRFEEFPNLWTSDADFGGMKKVSDANPQQAQYVWGRSEIVTYVNSDGKRLGAILTRPDNFDPAKKYPLMVYIYEELTSGLHRYVAPAPGTSINVTRFVSNGYVVLQPDIVYETGYPGKSAMKCVLPAVEQLVRQGYIDTARIGIQGHSWGGYQITYMITQTNVFRAVEAGASVSNMTSAYGGIRWGTGMSRAFQYERTQSRIGAPPWSRPLQFIENSPLFWVERVQTPYLTIHNDEDDAVPWYQGIEFFSAMRRLGKEAYMFNYNGEKHGLRERENQKHWTVYMCEFFDHYLLGASRPEWMDNPVPYTERGKRDIKSLYKPVR